MRKNLLTILIIAATLSLGLAGCGDEPLTEAYEYVPNRAPVVDSFTIVDSFGNNLIDTPADYLGPGMEIAITIIAHDPEGTPLDVDFSSNFGSFSSKSTDEGTTTVTFITNGSIIPGDPVFLTATLTDSKGMITTHSHNLGTGNSSLQISETTAAGQSPFTHVYNFTTPVAADERTFEFTSLIDGVYQVRTDEPVFNKNDPVYLYYADEGDTITVTVNNATHPLGSEEAHDVYIIFRDFLGNEAAFTKTVIADDTPPTGTISFANSRTSQDTAEPIIDVEDNLISDESIEMQISASSDFSGVPWVDVIPEAGTNHSVTINAPDEEKTFYVRFRDAAGNENSTYAASTTITRDTTGPGTINMSADPYSHRVELSWTNPATSDFQTVKIMRKTDSTPADPDDGAVVYSPAALAPGLTYSWTDDNELDNETLYRYAIFSIDDLGNWTRSTFNATPFNTPPTTPENLIDVSLNEEKVQLEWDESTDPDGEFNYCLYLDDGSGARYFDDFPSNSASIDMSGLLEDYRELNSIDFLVSAIDPDGGESPFSSPVTISMSVILPIDTFKIKNTFVADTFLYNSRAYLANFDVLGETQILDVSSPGKINYMYYAINHYGLAITRTDSYIFQTSLESGTNRFSGQPIITVYDRQGGGSIAPILFSSLKSSNLGSSIKNTALSITPVNSNTVYAATLEGIFICYFNGTTITMTEELDTATIGGNLNAMKIDYDAKAEQAGIASRGYLSKITGKYVADGFSVWDTRSTGWVSKFHFKDGAETVRFAADSFIYDDNTLFIAARKGNALSEQLVYIYNTTTSTVRSTVTIPDSTATLDTALDLCIADNLLFMAAGEDGVRVVDIAELDSPRYTFSMYPMTAYRVTTDGIYLYVSTGREGLRIYELSKIKEMAERRLKTK